MWVVIEDNFYDQVPILISSCAAVTPLKAKHLISDSNNNNTEITRGYSIFDASKDAEIRRIREILNEKIESQKEMGMESKIVHDQKIIGSILSSIHINIVINPHQYSPICPSRFIIHNDS